jgi:hypothetical protein
VLESPATIVTFRPVYVQGVRLPTSVKVPLFANPPTSSTSSVSFVPESDFAVAHLRVQRPAVALRLTALPVASPSRRAPSRALSCSAERGWR